MSKNTVLIAAFTICLAIILGAVGAHQLKKILSPELLETFEKGVRYQFYGGFSLLILGIARQKFQFSLKWFTILTTTGIILFSGCLYLYCLHEQVPALKPLVLIVPVGGSCMIIAWIVFIIQFFRFQK